MRAYRHIIDCGALLLLIRALALDTSSTVFTAVFIGFNRAYKIDYIIIEMTTRMDVYTNSKVFCSTVYGAAQQINVWS